MGFTDRIRRCCGKKGSMEVDTKDVDTKEDPDASQDPDKVEKNPPETGRIQWASPTEFLLTCIGYSVGLGNVWRFPYLCYKSGGGAFLIPYVIMIFIIGMPLLFMEYGFGQYFGVGSLSIFKKVCPLFQGVGIGYVVLNGLVCIYYNVIIAMSLYYLFASFSAELPWAACGHAWNTETCGDPIKGNLTENGTMWDTNSTMSMWDTSSTMSMLDTNNNMSLWNETIQNVTKRTSPTNEYFLYELMGAGPEHNVENIGQIRWRLCLCLLLAWILVVIFVSRGIQSTGKVAYFTATFPYVMLTVLVVRGVTLPGAAEGILYFISPRWEMLKDPAIWYGAATQLFYSTNLAWGGMITMSSYNNFNHNCYRDAIMINIVSFFTSIYAGFAVFAIIGYMAKEYDQDIADVIKSGPGLAFIVYPRALSLMPIPQLWSALFFFMLFLLGIGSQMVGVETVMSGLCDEYPSMRKHRFVVLLLVATLFFFCGLPATTQGGMHVLQLMDWYAAGACVLIIAIVECVVINWIYRNDRFASNMKEMLGKLPGKWWLICWKYISPLLLLGVLVFSFVEYKPATYGSYRYPAWADSLGWCMTMASVLPIIVVVIYKLVRSEGTTLREKWIKETTPLEDAMSKAEFIKNVKPDHNTKDVLVEDHVENHAEQADLADKIEEEDETAAQRRSLLKQQEANNSLETSAV